MTNGPPNNEKARTFFETLDEKVRAKDKVYEAFQERVVAEIERSMANADTHAIVKPTHHLYFGDLQKIGIVDRDDTFKLATCVSPVLEKLGKMEGEVPLYVFFLGRPADILELKKNRQGARSRFINAVIKAVLKVAKEEVQIDEKKVSYASVVQALLT
jgi:hypothetical protein